MPSYYPVPDRPMRTDKTRQDKMRPERRPRVAQYQARNARIHVNRGTYLLTTLNLYLRLRSV